MFEDHGGKRERTTRREHHRFVLCASYVARLSLRLSTGSLTYVVISSSRVITQCISMFLLSITQVLYRSFNICL